MNKEMKEIDQVMTNLWWIGEISDDAKMWWNDLCQQTLIQERGRE